MPSFGNMFASLTLESASFMSGMDAARKSLASTQKKFATVGANMAKVGAVMTVGITAPFTALVSSAIPAAVESQQAMAQVTAALKSMGPAAGHTADQLAGLAGRLQDTSNFDDDDIMKSVTANLLTFGKVQGEVFDRAEQSVVDISARMGTDLQSAAIMVGKALNDPLKGLKALGRAGIQFSAEQQEAIKSMVASGNAAGAQKIMLGELERQFGGAAKAQRDATPTAAQDQAWRTFQENVGAVALQALPAVTTAATTVLGAFNELSPGVQATIITVAALAAGLGPVIAGIGGVVTVVGAALPVLVTLAATITGTAIPALVSFAIAAAPIALPIIAATAAIAGIVLAVRNWDKIQPYVDKVVGWMGAMYQGVKTWVLDKLNAVWNSVGAGIEKVKGWFFGLYDAVVGHSYIPDMVDEIGENMRRLDVEMVEPARSATSAAAAAFSKLKDATSGILQSLFPQQAEVNELQTKLSQIDDALAAKLIDPATWAAARARLIAQLYAAQDAAARTVDRGAFDPDVVPTGMGPIKLPDGDEVAKETQDMWSKVQKSNDSGVASFARTARDIAATLGDLGRTIKSGDWFGTLSRVLELGAQFLGKGGQPAATTFPIGTGGFGGYRATGGPVMPGRSYMVGERGPEMLRMGGQGGAIVPNDQIGGGSVIQLMIGKGELFEPTVAAISGNVSVEAIRTGGRANATRARQALA